MDSFIAAYNYDALDNRECLIHFRITTRGDDSANNCHPFPLKNGALVHNGTIYGLGEVGVGKSDTAILAEKLFHEDFDTLVRLQDIIEEYLDGSKVAVLNADGRTLIFNESKWIQDDGVWYSNDGYKPGGGYSFSLASTSSLNDGAYGFYDDDEEPVRFNGFDTYDYYWEHGMLFRRNGEFYQRDYEMESEAINWWRSYAGVNGLPGPDDSEDLQAITEDLIDEENDTCPSTPTPSAPPTAINFEF